MGAAAKEETFADLRICEFHIVPAGFSCTKGRKKETRRALALIALYLLPFDSFKRAQ